MINNLLIFGDSYSTHKDHIPDGYAFYYCDGGRSPEEPVTKMTVEKTWWWQLIESTDAKLIRNDSWSGSTVCHTGYDNADWSDTMSFACRLDKLIAEGFFEKNQIDTVFIFGGTNDCWAKVPMGEPMYDGFTKQDLFSFLPAVSYVIKRFKEALPNANLIWIINTWLDEPIVQGIKTACEHYGIHALQLKNINKIAGHPSVQGMTDIKNEVLEFLNQN